MLNRLFFHKSKKTNGAVRVEVDNKRAHVKTKDCPECLSTVPAAATRCSFCTIPLTVAVEMPKQEQYPQQQYPPQQYPKQY